ncbi:arginine--tRNA ligase [Candidatus Saccharibacteria bacterium]|nr:arginine--tRNA ligase [Candidatus Saccharibacteria bacterium]
MKEIKNLLTKIANQLFELPKNFSIDITPAPELEQSNDFRADFATNVAMKLAGILHKNPREIAENLIGKLLEAAPDLAPELNGIKVEIANPGFINFMLPDEYYQHKLLDLHADFDKNISYNEYNGKTVVTEFSDPNPFKVLHIGHLYTSVMGESISRLIEFAGGTVHRVNFGGDVGLHVAKTLYSLEQKDLKEFTIEDIAKCYVEGTRAYEEDESANQEIVKLNKEIYNIAEHNLHDTKLSEDYWRGRELSYLYFNDFYARLDVKFEKYYPESSVAKRGLETVKAHPDVYQESEGAIVFKGEDYGLHTRVFINKEGLPTYEAKDVGLLFQKNDDYHFDESVVITGNDIIDYMKVVLKSVEQYAPELVERTHHITHGNVRLPGNEKMSSRKGNFIKAVDILNEVEGKAGTKTIADAAIKYSLLRYKIGGNIEFNIDDSVSLTGNSGPYLQYSAVRAKKILASLSTKPSIKHHWNLSPAELAINKKFLSYQSVLTDAVREKAPHLVANYLFELAQEFSRFYETCRVKDDPLEQERSLIVAIYERIITHGLNILGITIPEEM